MNPILLLHGALGSAAQLRFLTEGWPAERPVVALNLPGHGGEPADGPFSLDLFAQHLLHVLDQRGWSQADIFGYSMGGYAALWLARHHSERVGKITTLGTKLDWTPDVATGMNRLFDADKIAAKAPQMAEALGRVHGDWRLLCERTAAFLHDLGNGAGLHEADFQQITTPVCIGRGDADNVVSDVESRAVAEWLPNGRFVELPGVPHLLEQADRAVVREFLHLNL